MKDDFNFRMAYNEFKRKYKSLVERVDSYEENDDTSIKIYFKDGLEMIYDYELKRGKFKLPDNVDEGKHYDEAPNNKLMSEKEWRMSFSARLNDILKSKEIGSSDLSESSGIYEEAIVRYLKVERAPSTYNTIRLARALNCSVTDLIDIFWFAKKTDSLMREEGLGQQKWH